MTAVELYRQGKLDEAIEVLGAALRKDPADAQRRTFLFELLCFAGEYERAEKQLDVLAAAGRDSEMGGLLYRAALHAERTRQEMFRTGALPETGRRPANVRGTFNGTAFETLRDADPRIGARLEVFAAGQYTWIPFEHIESVRMEPPQRLRDLLWIPAIVRVGPSFPGLEIGEVLLPVVTPQAAHEQDGAVRLGQVTEYVELESGTVVPLGQKLWLVDDEEVPILELRELTIAAPAEPASPN